VIEKEQAFAIVRVDAFLGASAPSEEAVTATHVVLNPERAAAEVARLNADAGEGARYFWQTTRLLRSNTA
jgi:hypothetical protein